jgi:hypothetical protein
VFISSIIAPSYGTGDGEFSWVAGMTTDSLGNLYVVDGGFVLGELTQRVQKFDASGAYLTQWSFGSPPDVGFYEHIDLVADSSDNIYIGNAENGKIQKFTSNGVFIDEWQATSFAYGTGPSYLAIDSEDNIYVSFSDGEHHIYTANGVFLVSWTEPPPLNEGYYGISVAPDNRIYSVNFDDNKVYSFMNLIETFVPIAETPDLECNTTYHYRAYATTGATTIYGEDMTFTTTACDPVLQITTEFLPDETVGVTYDQIIETENYNGIVDFYLDSGTLPPGLSLGSSNLNGFTGQLSGTPTQVGEYTFTVRAEDSINVDTQQYTITINAPPDEDEPLQITTTALPDGTVGSPYSFSIEAINGNGPLTWSITAGALDTGLSLGSSNGLISGTPVLAGTYSLTVSVTDGDDADSAQFTHLVNPLADEPEEPPVTPPPGTPTPPKTGAGILALIVALSCASAAAILALFNAIKKWEIKEHSDK